MATEIYFVCGGWGGGWGKTKKLRKAGRKSLYSIRPLVLHRLGLFSPTIRNSEFFFFGHILQDGVNLKVKHPLIG